MLFFLIWTLTYTISSVSEFLIHAADVEGLCQGIDEQLVESESLCYFFLSGDSLTPFLPSSNRARSMVQDFGDVRRRRPK